MKILVNSLALVLLLAACAEKKTFGGGVKVTNAPETSPKTIDASTKTVSPSAIPVKVESTVSTATPVSTPAPAVTPAPALPSLPVCNKDRTSITEVTLLDNPSVKRDRPDGSEVLRYELSLVSCENGEILPLKDQNFLFDVNAATSNSNMTYEAFDALTNESIGKGSLIHTTGADLFGHVGKVWGRWENGSLSLPDGHAKIIIVMELASINEVTKGIDPHTLETFFRIGDSDPVKQALPFVY